MFQDHFPSTPLLSLLYLFFNPKGCLQLFLFPLLKWAPKCEGPDLIETFMLKSEEIIYLFDAVDCSVKIPITQLTLV